MIVFPCSDRSSWINGQTSSLNGGFSRKWNSVTGTSRLDDESSLAVPAELL